jgi:arabinofuranosyltransferase
VREVTLARDRGERLLAYRSVGIAGYYAGPSVHIVDEFALADPLLAHLPAEPGWRAGHFLRRVPPGYLETLRSGDNRIEDPWIAQRYTELRTLIAAPIFDAERLKTLLRWTLSRPSVYPPDYDVRRVAASEAARAPGDGASTSQPGVLSTGPQGLALVLDPPQTLQDASVTVGADDRYLVAFRSGDRVLWQVWLSPEERRSERLRTHHIHAPSPLRVDTILIRGRRGDHHYDVGRVELQPVVDVPPQGDSREKSR